MLSIFIMLFVAIGVAAGIGYSVVTLINTAQTSLTTQANQVRLQNVSNSIRAGLTVDGTKVLLPVLVDNEVVAARLPDSSPFSTTTSGADIVFCPAFPNPGSGTMLVNPLGVDGSEEFEVTTTELAGKTYATAGHANYADEKVKDRLAQMGVIAYLLSPQPNYQHALECRNVELGPDNYTLLVSGGSVVPIYTVTTDARGSVFTLWNGEDVPPGYNGNDRVVRTFADVASFIKQYNLTDITVRLPSTLPPASLADFMAFIDAGASRTLRLVPGDDEFGNELSHANLTIASDGSSVESRNVYLPVKGALRIDDVTVAGSGFDVAIEAMSSSDVVLTGSEVAGLKATGGRISTAGATAIRSNVGDDTGNNPVHALGGEIILGPETSVIAPSAVMVFRANAGNIILPEDLNVTTSGTSVLSAQQNGGRVVVPLSRIVDENGQVITPSIPVTRNGVTAPEPIASSRETVSQVCGDGSTSCEAVCTGGKVVVSGGCSNTNGTPLVSFGPVETGNAQGVLAPALSYSCEFAALPAVSDPKATAICDFR
ncbi:hypothetical protein GOB57_08505 [Sinorhizobium meliloti]|nr:hypothetical protein [Sinorhizobium meliloti]